MSRETDYTGKIVNYIKQNLKKGYSEEVLRQALLRQDHSKIQIERALETARSELAKEAPVLKTKPVIKYEVIEHSPVTHHTPEPEKKPFWKRLFG